MHPFDSIGMLCLVGSVGLTALVYALFRLRGTTLVAAAGWALAGWLASVGTALAGIRAEGDAASPMLRWCCGIAMLCPTMALLGAKRPQHTAWQWIVLATFFVLSMPAAHNWLYASASGGEVHPAWLAPVVALMIAGPVNYLPTRRLPAVLVAAAGQWLWFAPWLPWLGTNLAPNDSRGWSLVLLAVGAGMSALGSRGEHAPQGVRLWVDFRNWYGVLWALRVAERVNQQARASGSRQELGWFGPIDGANGQVLPSLPAELAGPLASILPRFVSPTWIAERMPESAPAD